MRFTTAKGYNELKALEAKRAVFMVNPLGETGMRWIENVSKGWRFVGYADELSRSIQHTGWFTDSDGCSETMRGVVYRLPSRKGKSVYAVGYADPYNDDCALLTVDTSLDDESEAAYRADRIAERCAETEREYQDAWQLGREYAEASETISTERQTRRKLIAELRKLQRLDVHAQLDTPTICKTLQDALKRSKKAIQDAYSDKKRIANDYIFRGDLINAFADGAGLTLAEAEAI